MRRLQQKEEALRVVQFQLGDIHARALRAEEVIRAGVWCLNMLEPGSLPPLGLKAERLFEELQYRPRKGAPEIGKLKGCGNAALRAARGIIEQWPEWAVDMTQVMLQAHTLLPDIPGIHEPRAG